jgi:two-component system response regulator PrrA
MRSLKTGVVLVASARGVCDDDVIHEQLCAAGLSVRLADDLEDAIRSVADMRPDVLVLGTRAGEDTNGCKAVARVRAAGFAGAILVVGHDPDSSSVVAALDCGADDYVRLPCNATELVARVRALARRGAGVDMVEHELEGLVLDLRRGVIRGDGVEVALTRREADLFDYLARNAGHPVSRGELAAKVWHVPPTEGSTNVVDVYVSYLRRKLAAVGRQSLIRSVRGVGYQMCEDYHANAE